MRLPEAAQGSRIISFGAYQPARVVTNDELAATIDTTDEWIRSRVGIASRRIAGPDETLADMAAAGGGQRPVPRGHRPGDRGDVHPRIADPERRGDRRDPAWDRGARRIRPERGLRGFLLRAGHRE